MSTVEAPHSELSQTPRFIQPDKDRTTSYKPKEILSKIAQADNAFVDQSPTGEQVKTYLDELRMFMDHIKNLPSGSENSQVALLEQELNESLMQAEIGRIRRNIYMREKRSLSGAQALAQWQTSATKFIRDTLHAYGPEKPRSHLQEYWKAQKHILSAEFPKIKTTDLQEEFQQQKRGILAAVAFEESMTHLKEWNIQPADPKLDAGRAIDYVIESPNNNTFFIQLTSTARENAPAAACGQVTEKQKQGSVSEKEMRFRRGVSAHISRRNIDPSTVRAVFITLSQKCIDQVSGVPERTIQQELTEALESIEERHGGWENTGKPSYKRKP